METPLACNISAIKTDDQQKHKDNGEQVLASVKEVNELPNGFAFHLPAETQLIEKAAAFIALERLCCAFFKFTLEITSGHGPVWLKITGDKPVKKFVKENIVSRLNSQTKIV